jgi:hypothetical protein
MEHLNNVPTTKDGGGFLIGYGKKKQYLLPSYLKLVDASHKL